MSTEVFFFIAAAMVAFMPTIWDMKVKGKNLNWWNRLTSAGKIYIIAFGSFFGTGLYLTINSHNESLVKEITSKERIKSDSLLMSNLRKDVTKLVKSDSLYESAIKKSGYKFDAINGVIVNRNFQQVEKGSSAFQNNATNYGNQAGRDINLSNEKKLNSEEIKELIESTKKIMSDSSLNCLEIFMEARSNGNKVYAQIMDAFTKAGFKPMGGVSHDSMIEEGIVYRIRNKCLKITVGLF